MELLQFTGEAKAALHALTKAIEGLRAPADAAGAARGERIIELHDRDVGFSWNRLAFLATEIAGVEEDEGHLAIVYMKSSRSDGNHHFCVEEQYNDVLRMWKEALA